MCYLCLWGFLDVLNSNLLFIVDIAASLLRQYKQLRAPEVASGRAGRLPPTLRGGRDLGSSGVYAAAGTVQSNQ